MRQFRTARMARGARGRAAQQVPQRAGAEALLVDRLRAPAAEPDDSPQDPRPARTDLLAIALLPLGDAAVVFA
ncbi:hypothetical protein ACS04_34880 [Streptomyces roseus]|uniref:Uncharacterized protein n=1 Tax=Streptomyces roseus TaxID=66430 RepID=A0A0J6XEC9_9ACTN|nr:hypothetical protein ACS04_34880 [Streptomyces roseus]